MNLLIALLILVLSCAPHVPTVSLAFRVTEFCGVYQRSIDCTAWTQGVLTTAGTLARECHDAYPPGEDVPFMFCLEEYGL